MLTPTYLQNSADDVVELYSKLDESITRDIVRRILKTGKLTDTAKWQAEMVQQSGLLYDEVIQSVADISGASESAVEAIFKDAAVESTTFDNAVYEAAGLSPKPLNMSPAAINVLKAGLSKTNGLIKNLTKTTALQAQDAYINACTLAEMQITSGAFDYNTAIKHAVNDAIEQGATVRYPPKPGQVVGHVDTLETAVRRSVMTGVSQTAGQISEGYANDMGCDLMEITAHGGARPTHVHWQGKIVSLSGKTGYESKDSIGYGTGAGFKGYNCRHDWYPYFEGISTRAYTKKDLKAFEDKTVEYNGKQYSQYEAEQLQRGMERSVRKSKQRLAGYDEARKTAPTDKLKDEFDTDFYAESQKLKAKKAKYADFCEKTGLPPDTARMQTRGYNRSVSGKAVAAQKKAGKVPKAVIEPIKAATPSFPAGYNPARVTSQLRETEALNEYDYYTKKQEQLRRSAIKKASGFDDAKTEEVLEAFSGNREEYLRRADSGRLDTMPNQGWFYGGDGRIRQLADADATRKAGLINDYIVASPKYEGTVYRGLSLDEDTIKRFQEGSTFTENGALSSWSSKSDVADMFAAGRSEELGTTPVIMSMTNPSYGVPTSHLSVFGSEESEILVSNMQSAEYIISSVERKGGVVHVHLSEK